MILSEFGVLYSSGCCGRPVDPSDKIESFMCNAVRWLSESGAVDAWAWFAADARPYNGSLLDRTGAVNNLGTVYRGLVRASQGREGE